MKRTQERYGIIDCLRRIKLTQLPQLARTIRSMGEKPSEISFEVMTNQLVKDIVAAEKLRALEAINREAAPIERRGARIHQYSS